MTPRQALDKKTRALQSPVCSHIGTLEVRPLLQLHLATMHLAAFAQNFFRFVLLLCLLFIPEDRCFPFYVTMYRPSSPTFAAELAGDAVPLNYSQNQTFAARLPTVYDPRHTLQPPNHSQLGPSSSLSSISSAATEPPRWQYTVSQPASAVSPPESTVVWNQRLRGGEHLVRELIHLNRGRKLMRC
jgi:hypothetical protein